MIKTATALAPNEQFRLEQCEKVIERGVKDVGRALMEIRDSKLYRLSHKTFEAYCKERWGRGRSWSYELIDHAKVTGALVEAGVDLSGIPDISANAVRVLKADPTASAKAIRARIDKGEPADQAAKAVAADRKTEKTAKQAENDRQREEHRAALPESIKIVEAAKDEAKAASKDTKAENWMLDSITLLKDRVAEYEQHVAVLEAELSELRAENKLFGDMRAEFEKGGFAEVIAGKDEVIRAQATRIEGESRDKASWMRSAKFWQEQALALGYSRDVAIDVETGEIVQHHA